MAIIECPECNHSVSELAQACPSCAFPLQNANTHPLSGPARPVAESPQYNTHSGGNELAAVASFFIPGLGQLAQGRFLDGFVHFVLAILLWLVLLGWIVHLVSAWGAARWRP